MGYAESSQGITRRDLLKRGAVVGGTVLWATPVVQTVGMARAYAAEPSDTCVASWADAVISSSQGLTSEGNPIAAGRSNPASALGAPNATFFSLGYGGSIVVRLAVPYYSGKNGEAIVVETSGGVPPYNLEKAAVSVSGGRVNMGVCGIRNQSGAGPGCEEDLYTS